MNLAGFLAASGRTHGDRPAVQIGQSVYLDYAALARQAAGLASALRARGLDASDRVVLVMSNNRDYLTIMFACWHAGLTVVPVNAKLHPREIDYIVRDASARIVFVTDDLAEGISRQLPALPMIVPGTAGFRQMTAHAPIAEAETAPDDIAWVFYTSGTTGRPKGALLTHRNLFAMTLAYLADVDQLTPADSLLHLAATSHASGLFALSFIAKAGAHILPASGGYEPAEMKSIIATTPNLTFFAPSTLLNRMESDLRGVALENIRTILTGAGPIYLADMKRWLAAFGPRLWNGYGQGESPCTITALPKSVLWDAYENNDTARMRSVGVARTGISVRIAHPGGRTAASGEIGEVLVRGETVMKGYLNNPDATAKALIGGWLHTGDLARMDDRGFVTLLDRQKDVIISGGMNVYAREVEEVLLRHPAVAECAVIGLKDADWGESVMALIVPRAQYETADLDALCLEHLARFKRPRRYESVAELPKNAAGKVLKAQLRQQWSDPAP